MTEDIRWYKDAIIYQVHVKSFKDSNNDGIGDFGGLIEKMDHFEKLGVTALWVMPFFPSPLKDDGYDIADYYGVHPNYGCLEDFITFVKEAHKRNLKVIIELAINHTSDQHPWFIRAKKALKGSSHHQYYVWSQNPDEYKGVRIIFRDFEESNWTWDQEVESYYWHRFYHHQPDLNFENPDVQKEIFKILDYWIGLGVDGFRLDAIPYLFEEEGTSCENLPQTHAFLQKLRKYTEKNHGKEILFLAEANMWPKDSAAYFGNENECHMNYHFPLMPRLYMSIKKENRNDIVEILKTTPLIPDSCQWAIFLRNHDELTLEMVTDEDRQFMWDSYNYVPEAKINLGIRLRLARLMDGRGRKMELIN
ncbi:MAG: alpha-amylase, partial [Bacteroidetes bacterium]|nr:alpha-amylase [Bacteroidota bacterium]